MQGAQLHVVCDGLLSRIFQRPSEENTRGFVVAVTSATVLPAARPAPKADMPTLILPVPPKVSCLPDIVSWVVVAARLGSGSPPARTNVIWEPVPMSAVAFWLRVTSIDPTSELWATT